MSDRFNKFSDKLPLTNKLLIVKDFFGKVKEDILIKVEFINNEVVYTWNNSGKRTFYAWKTKYY